jgi:uncharacterized protein YsxB (DUF464 family)
LIDIEAVLDENEILRSCKASGHAGAGKTGSDIVCAAVSVLIRTAACTLSDREGITVRYEAPEPGLFFLEADYTDGKDFLFAVGVFLIEGLALVAEEYPENCRLTIRRT